MPASLPKKPNLEHLRKSAKQLLAAYRQGDARCCMFLRRLRRFREASDEDILSSEVTLSETQFLVAMHYGFSSWDRLRRHIGAQRTTNENSLEAVGQRCPQEIPMYAGAGVPLAVTAALNHAGVSVDFMEFAAASGWAFSFGYKYDDISPAFMAVRGHPRHDGPLEVFAFLPPLFGFGYELVRTTEHHELWNFVVRHVDAGTPILCEHLDGGLITGYQEHDSRRQLFFDGTVASGWTDVDKLNPYAVYVLVKERDELRRDEITHKALKRAAVKGSAHEWKGAPQGMAALQSYLADVADPTRSFDETEEWFCWAAFERLMARRCCEVWLRSAAVHLKGKARDLTLAAARHYGQAFAIYERYRSEISTGESTRLSLRERARTPERISVIVPILEEAIAAEAKGLSVLKRAVETLGDAPLL